MHGCAGKRTERSGSKSKHRKHGTVQDQNTQDQNRDRDNDIRYQEVATINRFLEDHSEIAEALRKDPSQCNCEEFLKTHPEVRAYLQEHPEIRADLKENAAAFVQQGPTYGRPDSGMDRDAAGRYASFGEILGGDADISDQLSKDPTLVKNQEYLQNHPELRDYLTAHPDVQQEMLQNPESFVKSAQQFNNNNGVPTVKSPTGSPKPQ